MESDGLLAVIEVPYEARVRCMAPRCGHSVYKRVHIVRQAAELLVLGSDCFSRIYAGQSVSTSAPRLTTRAGRLLTDEERALLARNTDKLIEQFEAERTVSEQKPAPVTPKPPASADDFLLFNRPKWQPKRLANVPRPFARKPDQFTPAQRAQVEPEARAKLNSQFPGIDLDSPGFNGLLQSEIERILRGRMA